MGFLNLNCNDFRQEWYFSEVSSGLLLKSSRRLSGIFARFSKIFRMTVFVGGVTTRRFCKGVFVANVPLPPFGVKVHPPRAFALLKDKITSGRCTFTPVLGVIVQLPKPPFWKPPFCDTQNKAAPEKIKNELIRKMVGKTRTRIRKTIRNVSETF